jgi:short-chain fatty acids transporter
MAITYGDTWTNLLQPFWALPMLAIARMKVQDMIGYSILACIVNGLVTGGLLLILPQIF